MANQSIVIQGNTITNTVGKGIRFCAADGISVHGNTFITASPNTFKRLFNKVLHFWPHLVQHGKKLERIAGGAVKSPATTIHRIACEADGSDTVDN